MTAIVSQSLPVPTVAASDRAITVNLNDVCVRLGERWALNGVTLEIGPATLTGVLGRNGAGKTTLLRVMAGLLRPDHGSVLVCGHTPGSAARRGVRVGYVGHAPMLYAELTVRENLELFAKCHGVSNIPEAVHAVMHVLGLLDRSHDRVGTLSRGLQQRAGLARALVHEPHLLLVDEPDTGLDEPSQRVVEQCLDERRRRGAAVIITGHHIDRVLAHADRAIMLADGCIQLDERVESVNAARVRQCLGGGA